MEESVGAGFLSRFQLLKPASDEYVPELVRLILNAARAARASDVHLVPTEAALMMQWRVDGVLHSIAGFDADLATRVVARLKVISGLLTYRTDVPQEGRAAREHSASEVRITTFPTLHGERAAIRLFAENTELQSISQLGLPPAIESGLKHHLDATAGVILITGPSGSGKTTTAYACLREIIGAAKGSRCVMTLEDPVEVAVDGATQSQVRPNAGFTLEAGLRSLMRQDPDVILVGEIRDPASAETAFQAALTGHLVLTTFHAGSSAEALTRLLEMNIEPYLIRSGLRQVICQRLIRRACPTCVLTVDAESGKFGAEEENTDESRAMTSRRRCSVCGSTGYFGRLILAESLDPDIPEVTHAILQRLDARQIAKLAEHAGMRTLHDAAREAVLQGLTTREEILRVLGRKSG